MKKFPLVLFVDQDNESDASAFLELLKGTGLLDDTVSITLATKALPPPTLMELLQVHGYRVPKQDEAAVRVEFEKFKTWCERNFLWLARISEFSLQLSPLAFRVVVRDVDEAAKLIGPVWAEHYQVVLVKR
jgi:hypothetical protein